MTKLPPAFRQIPAGRELLEGFAEAFAAQEGWVFATGSVDDVELKLASHGADARRAFKGHFTLAHLSGPLGGPYGVTLARLDGERVESLSGVLLRARSAGVSALCLAASGELLLEPKAPAPPRVEAPEPKAQTAGSAFAAEANRAARALVADEPELDEGEPERGDLIQHFTFGICEVLNAEGDRLLIRDLSTQGRVREIRTDMLVVHPPIERDGKRLFRLTRRG